MLLRTGLARRTRGRSGSSACENWITGASAAVTFPAIWALFWGSLSANASVERSLASYAVSPFALVTFCTKCRSRWTPPAANVAYPDAMSAAVTCGAAAADGDVVVAGEQLAAAAVVRTSGCPPPAPLPPPRTAS